MIAPYTVCLLFKTEQVFYNQARLRGCNSMIIGFVSITKNLNKVVASLFLPLTTLLCRVDSVRFLVGLIHWVKLKLTDCTLLSFDSLLIVLVIKMKKSLTFFVLFLPVPQPPGLGKI